MNACLLAATIALSVHAHNGCISSTGASISIISPGQGQQFSVGDVFEITWAIVNGSPAFNNVSLTFEIDDASNANNEIPVPNGSIQSTTPASVHVSDLQAIAHIPAVASSSKYALRASYRDIGATPELMECFSPVFAVVGGSQPPAVTTTTKGGAVVVVSTVPTAAVVSTGVKPVSTSGAWTCFVSMVWIYALVFLAL